ncbi:tripartite tricarboxylate transporter substrate binding protein [Ramlibacter sp. AN1015]|uniref:tripartite tricarboxylate transporter substrate binding protein n=1 Tax=Ramlibacter sp. AN1015 TaxID=3133428 RepID=UPI0030C3D2EF
MFTSYTRILVAGAIALLAAPSALAQDYPSRPIKMIVPFAAGGGMDTVGRLLGRELSEAMGQPVVVENRGGAGGVIGTDAVAKAAPDGYTVGMVATGHTINPTMHAKLPYDTLADLRGVTPVVRLTNFVVVSPTFAAANVNELLDQARRNPGKVTFGSGGNGTAQHLFPELLANMAGVKFQHVPYKGGAPALADIAAGHVNMMFATVVETQALVNAGKIKAIAVTGQRRAERYPDVPTVAESGVPGFDGDTWFGLVVPAGTPDAIVTRLNAEVKKVLARSEVQQQLMAQGAQPYTTTPQAFDALIKEQVEVWRRVVQASAGK